VSFAFPLWIARSLLDRENLLTDGGKDFRSNHLQQISAQLGFVCHLRDRPSAKGELLNVL
jgi:hypothetical protein